MGIYILALVIKGKLQLRNSSRIDALKTLIDAGEVTIDNLEIMSKALYLFSDSSLNITDSKILTSSALTHAEDVVITDSDVLASDNIFIQAIENFISVNSNIQVNKDDVALFTYKAKTKDQYNNSLLRCGLEIAGTEVLGIADFRPMLDRHGALSYKILNSASSAMELAYSMSKGQKGVYIDANKGYIMGGSISAKDHRVMVKTKSGLEFVPVGLYNLAIFSGGINPHGVEAVMTKIEAGIVDIDAGYLDMLGALIRASQANISTDYLYNLDSKVAIKKKHDAL